MLPLLSNRKASLFDVRTKLLSYFLSLSLSSFDIEMGFFRIFLCFPSAVLASFISKSWRHHDSVAYVPRAAVVIGSVLAWAFPSPRHVHHENAGRPGARIMSRGKTYNSRRVIRRVTILYCWIRRHHSRRLLTFRCVAFSLLSLFYLTIEENIFKQRNDTTVRTARITYNWM